MKSASLLSSLAMLVVLVMGAPDALSAADLDSVRFFHSGNGVINLISEKNGKTFSGRYRDAGGHYRDDALGAIAAVFDAPYDPARPLLSLRLIEFLDFLEDRLKPEARLRIMSGYRAPTYNANLRKRGALAAKASLHQYGMAADIVMTGVSSKTVWETVRELGFGGAGYYHGRMVHVDVGPARFWDEKTSGVGTGASDDNKLIGVVTDYDVYAPGDRVNLSFIRMTAFPIGVYRDFRLLAARQPDNPGAGIEISLDGEETPHGTRCDRFGNIDQMRALAVFLPTDLPAGRYRIEARFCDNPWEKMPAAAMTPEFEVRRP
ncbi:hypothetical protein JCM12296A_29390 [Desulfosarcina cetonica]